MSDTDQKELETLRRMLATPPTPHKEAVGSAKSKRPIKRDGKKDE